MRLKQELTLSWKFGGIIKLYIQYLPKSNHFRYLQLIIHKDGKIHEDVGHRIRVGWMKYKNVSKALCGCRIYEVEENSYCTGIKTCFALLYIILRYYETICSQNERNQNENVELYF